MLTGPWAFAVLLGSLASCAGSEPQGAKWPTVREELAVYDQQMNWGLIYYQSWIKEKNPRYLVLSREHIFTAVNHYHYLQREMGTGFPDYYIVNRRRRIGCTYLKELDAAALRYQVDLPNTSDSGCWPD